MKLQRDIPITSATAIDLNTLEFTTGLGANEHVVRLHRHMSGWDVYMRITVDEVRWHDAPADKSDKELFYKIEKVAFDARSIREDRARHETNEVAKRLFDLKA